MKKQIVSTIVLAGMIIGSTDAFASRAREAVMGTGDTGMFLNGGSMYYDSMYNSFYNPAYINDFKNWAIIEKGAQSSTAEGGFAASMMNFNVGVFFNRTDAFNMPYTLGQQTTFPSAGVRPIDLIVGGDMGVKWGFGLTHASSKGGAANAKSASHITLRAGVSVADFDPYIHYRLAGKSETQTGTTTSETKAKDMQVGLRYHYGEWTPYAAYRTGEVEVTGATEKPKFTAYMVGVGRNAKLGEGARLVYGIAAVNGKTEKVTGGNTKNFRMPVNVALEGDLASWFTIRGGLEYRLVDRAGGEATTNAGSVADNTTARIGASIHANKFDIDWAFGQAAAGNIDSDEFGFDGETFSNVSVSYKW